MVSTIMTFLGGLGLFLYGVQITSTGLQKFAASRLKSILKSLTQRTFVAILLGIVMTVAFQSSAATTVLVVEFVNAELMSLAQALGIVLGSAVGTSVTIQLIAFQMLDVALGLIFMGLVLYLWIKAHKWKYLGQGLIGFGIIFVGMAYMSDASAPLQHIPAVYTFLSHLGHYPVLAIFVGLVLTTVIQSTTAIFALMMSLSSHHMLSIGAIIPLVLGAHVGGTMTTLFASLTAEKMDAKRAAIANTGYKIVGMILILPFLSQFAHIVQWTTMDLRRQVANAHLLFALFMVVIFFPFNNIIARLLGRWLPDKPDSQSGLHFEYIDEASLEVPTVALAQASQEIAGVGQLIATQMIRQIPAALLATTNEFADAISHVEVDVDWYYRHISRFLYSLAYKGLTEEEIEENTRAQFVLKELEYIGDISMSVIQITRKLKQDNLAIPIRDWELLRELYDKVDTSFRTLLKAIRQHDQGLAGQLIREHPEIIRLQRTLQFAMLQPETDAKQSLTNQRSYEKLRYAEMDLLNLFNNIDEHTVNIAQAIMGIV